MNDTRRKVALVGILAMAAGALLLWTPDGTWSRASTAPSRGTRGEARTALRVAAPSWQARAPEPSLGVSLAESPPSTTAAQAKPPGAIAGSVVDDRGAPIVGALVRVVGFAGTPGGGSSAAPKAGPGGPATFEVAPLPGQTLGVTAGEVPPLPLAYGEWPDNGFAAALLVRTGADGSFRTEGVPPGAVQLIAAAPGHAPAQSAPLAVASDATVSGVEVVLRAGSMVGGVVSDERGFPVERVLVRAEAKEPPKLPFPPAFSNAKGEFELRDLPAGNYSISFERDGYARERREAAVAASGSVRLEGVVLRATGTVSGEVVDALGAPVEAAEVAIGSPPSWKEATRTDAHGHFRLAGIAPGEHRVTARHAAAGESSAPPARVLALEETPGVVVRLPRYSSR